jgi:hypothetical protein
MNRAQDPAGGHLLGVGQELDLRGVAPAEVGRVLRQEPACIEQLRLPAPRPVRDPDDGPPPTTLCLGWATTVKEGSKFVAERRGVGGTEQPHYGRSSHAWRNLNFCTFPVGVSGSSSTNET